MRFTTLLTAMLTLIVAHAAAAPIAEPEALPKQPAQDGCYRFGCY